MSFLEFDNRIDEGELEVSRKYLNISKMVHPTPVWSTQPKNIPSPVCAHLGGLGLQRGTPKMHDSFVLNRWRSKMNNI